MKKYLLFLFLCSCGEEPFLKEGVYDVSIYYTQDDWPDGFKGETHEAQWRITEYNDMYKLEILNTNFIYEGKRENKKIIFKYEDVKLYNDNCEFVNSLIVEIFPNLENNERFVGNGVVRFDIGVSSTEKCIVYDLYTKSDFKGRLLND